VKDENEDLLAYSHNNVSRKKNYFSGLLNVHNVSDVRLPNFQIFCTSVGEVNE
jgi:hypothetical protein